MAVLSVEIVKRLRFQSSILLLEIKLLRVDIYGATSAMSTLISSSDESASDAKAFAPIRSHLKVVVRSLTPFGLG